jgi:hypothetical protein
LTTPAINPDPIATYLADLRQRLSRGLVRHSADRTAQILAEAEDHLRTAAAASAPNGMAAEDTQRAAITAIAAFGSVKSVARAHRPRAGEILTTLGLATAQLAIAYVILVAVIAVAWQSFEGRDLLGVSGFLVVVGISVLATLALPAAYLIGRRRLASTGHLPALPVALPGFFPPAAAIIAAADCCVWLYLLFDRSPRIWLRIHLLHYRVGILEHSQGLVAILAGAVFAAFLVTVACTLWSMALAGRWSYSQVRALATR